MRADKPDKNRAGSIVGLDHQPVLGAFNVEDDPIARQEISAAIAPLEQIKNYPTISSDSFLMKSECSKRHLLRNFS